MKKLVMVAILVISQLTFAAMERVMNRAEAKAKVETNTSYKKIKEKVSNKKDLTAAELAVVKKAVEASLNGSGVSSSSIHLLVAMNPEIIADVMVKSSIVQKSTDVKEVAKAKADLEILEAGGKALDVNSARAELDLQIITQTANMTEYNKSAAEFRTKFKELIAGGMTIEKAMKELIMDENLFKDCVI